ncbi:hypothetical protein NDU88_000313 [Pleurodeles waltl]|uniref:Uncharacterized protein n=1 Tax=Pleurodeles waltl TaxID=8319 RepID=A0AAV7L9F5_PLEWA|nr:hypothetical protein NDU88_000313 [Pleurodeles waltl]
MCVRVCLQYVRALFSLKYESAWSAPGVRPGVGMWRPCKPDLCLVPCKGFLALFTCNKSLSRNSVPLVSFRSEGRTPEGASEAHHFHSVGTSLGLRHRVHPLFRAPALRRRGLHSCGLSLSGAPPGCNTCRGRWEEGFSISSLAEDPLCVTGIVQIIQRGYALPFIFSLLHFPPMHEEILEAHLTILMQRINRILSMGAIKRVPDA